MNIIELAKQVGYPLQHPEWQKATEEFAALVEAAVRAQERDRACAYMRQMHDAYSIASYPPRGTT
jgi:TolA-binding protein